MKIKFRQTLLNEHLLRFNMYLVKLLIVPILFSAFCYNFVLFF